MRPKALVLYGYGINCDYETQYAFERAGADAARVHINELISGDHRLEEYQILSLPGGFSFADDIGAGKVFANRFKYNLEEPLQRFIRDDKLVIGICNGFQTMTKMGILPGLDGDYRTQLTTVTYNDSGRFEDRWVYLTVFDSSCVFTRGIERLYFPVRHGEGKFIPKDDHVLHRLYENKQVVLKYCDINGDVHAGYPWNPNGSVDAIAGICDETGKIFGLMPHPEGYLFRTNHPRWTREHLPEEGLGLQVFKNAVSYFK
jgi:phosphoribosylformylglycinamidine synthase I